VKNNLGQFFQKLKQFLHHYRYDFVVLGLIVFSFFLIWQQEIKIELLQDRQLFESYVASFGIWGPVVIVLVIVAEVVFAPIPGFVPALSAGFIFGSFWGTIFTYLGNIIGTAIVFFLARKIGRPVIEKLFKKERLTRYEKAINRHENWLLFFYFLPILPLDILTAAFGLSVTSARKFFFVAGMGYAFYSLVLNFFGDYLASLVF